MSVGPIRSSADGTLTICGRCDKGALQNHGPFFRNVLFESIAQFLLFPSSSDCFCKTFWNAITIHKEECPEKRIDCFYPNCSAFVKFKELIAHFEHMHRVYTGYKFMFYLGVLNSGVRLIAFDAYIFVFCYVVRPCTIWFNMLNVNYVNKETLHFRLKTLSSPMCPNLVNNRYRIKLWNQIDHMLYTDDMYYLRIPFTSAPETAEHFLVVEVVIEEIGIEDAPQCPDCSRKMVEENCRLCLKGHAFCLDCYQEPEFCPECTAMKTKSLGSNWILDYEDDNTNSD